MPASSGRRRLAAGALFLLMLPAAPAWADPGVERVAGSDRIETAVHASERGWSTSSTALVATADPFPDALAAVPLAADRDAPLLLTTAGSLSEGVGDELVRLDADEVLVLGGGHAVDESVVDEIESLPTAPTVTRLAGEDRYGTAATVAEAVGAAGDEAVVALGEDFPDAVSAGALAGSAHTPPVLLTRQGSLPERTGAALQDLDVDTVVVVGGSGAVSEAVVDEIEATGASVERLAGPDRYETSAAVAAEALRRHGDGPLPAVLATGHSHPDALAAGSLTAQLGGVLVLARPRQPDEALDGFLRARTARWEKGIVIGGPAALSDDALESIGRSLRAEAHPEPEQAAPGEVAVEEAQRHIGKPYRYGGNGPDSFDCSGLTRWAWREAGVELPRRSRDQYAQARKIAASERQPGDLIAWGNPVHHVAIYAGNGEMVEAPSSGGHVRQVPVRMSGLRGYARPGS